MNVRKLIFSSAWSVADLLVFIGFYIKVYQFPEFSMSDQGAAGLSDSPF
jgi:hypothetical protein